MNYNQKLYRDTSKFNKQNFLDDVNDLVEKLSNDLSSMKQNITAQIDETCAQFISKFSEIVNTHAPLKQLSKKKGVQRKKTLDDKGDYEVNFNKKIKCMQNAIKKINQIYSPIIKNT